MGIFAKDFNCFSDQKQSELTSDQLIYHPDINFIDFNHYIK